MPASGADAERPRVPCDCTRMPAATEMADVFISYRRDDSRSAVGRLTDSLQAAFGPQRIFRDLDSIAPGQDFEAALARAIDGTSVMLAVIGPRWIGLRDTQGGRRLDDAGAAGQCADRCADRIGRRGARRVWPYAGCRPRS